MVILVYSSEFWETVRRFCTIVRILRSSVFSNYVTQININSARPQQCVCDLNAVVWKARGFSSQMGGWLTLASGGPTPFITGRPTPVSHQQFRREFKILDINKVANWKCLFCNIPHKQSGLLQVVLFVSRNDSAIADVSFLRIVVSKPVGSITTFLHFLCCCCCC